MCLNCGCHLAHDKHGDDANITYEDLKAAADANDMGIMESLAMMMETADADRHDHPDEYKSG